MTKISVLSIFVALYLISIFGCVLAIPVAVKYVKDMDKINLTMKVDGNASDIFDAAVRSQMKKYPETEIITEDRENLIFEGKRVEESGIEIWGRWKGKQVSAEKTEIEFSLKAEGMEEQEIERRAVNRIQAFCIKIGKRCEITK